MNEKRFLFVLGCLLMAILISACSSSQAARALSVAGATGAGVALGHGSGGAAAVLGVGAIVASLIAENELRKEDMLLMDQTMEMNRTGQVTQWVNPETGAQFAVIPGQPFCPTRQVPVYAQAQPASHQPVCRSMEMRANINGRPEIIHSVACRNAYGEWEIQGNMQPNS